MQGQKRMSRRAERALTAAIDLLLFPGRMAPAWLSRIATIGLVSGIVLPLAFAIPPLRNYLSCTVFPLRNVNLETREAIKNWCDFVTLTCQVLLVLMVGGILITDKIANAWRSRAEKIQIEIERMMESIRTGSASPRLVQYVTELENLKRGVTWLNFPTRLARVSVITDRIYDLAVPKLFNMSIDAPPMLILLGMRLQSNFPGGYYGVFIFGLFVAMISSTVVKTYFDYAAVC